MINHSTDTLEFTLLVIPNPPQEQAQVTGGGPSVDTEDLDGCCWCWRCVVLVLLVPAGADAAVAAGAACAACCWL